MWSDPPAEPPFHDTLPGSALNALTRSPMFLNGEEAGTTTTRYSLVRRAIGVTIVRSTGDLFSAIPPTITMPPTSIAFGSPFALLTNCASPIVPAAPPLFSNCTDCTTFALCIAAASARPVWSQPPPGFAGIIIFNVLIDCAPAVPSPANEAVVTAANVAIENSRRFMRVSLVCSKGRAARQDNREFPPSQHRASRHRATGARQHAAALDALFRPRAVNRRAAHRRSSYEPP